MPFRSGHVAGHLVSEERTPVLQATNTQTLLPGSQHALSPAPSLRKDRRGTMSLYTTQPSHLMHRAHISSQLWQKAVDHYCIQPEAATAGLKQPGPHIDCAILSLPAPLTTL